jgi:hypothetical protein
MSFTFQPEENGSVKMFYIKEAVVYQTVIDRSNFQCPYVDVQDISKCFHESGRFVTKETWQWQNIDSFTRVCHWVSEEYKGHKVKVILHIEFKKGVEKSRIEFPFVLTKLSCKRLLKTIPRQQKEIRHQQKEREYRERLEKHESKRRKLRESSTEEARVELLRNRITDFKYDKESKNLSCTYEGIHKYSSQLGIKRYETANSWQRNFKSKFILPSQIEDLFKEKDSFPDLTWEIYVSEEGGKCNFPQDYFKKNDGYIIEGKREGYDDWIYEENLYEEDDNYSSTDEVDEEDLIDCICLVIKLTYQKTLHKIIEFNQINMFLKTNDKETAPEASHSGACETSNVTTLA